MKYAEENLVEPSRSGITHDETIYERDEFLDFRCADVNISEILERSHDIREHIYNPRSDEEECNHNEDGDENDGERILQNTLTTFVEGLHSYTHLPNTSVHYRVTCGHHTKRNVNLTLQGANNKVDYVKFF
jgi:hypothetical protein